MEKSYIYMLLALLSAAAFVVIVPKEMFKRNLLYGLVFGGLGDAALATVLTLVGLIKYRALGPFDILGIFSLWTPIGWTYAFGVFFHLLPRRRFFVFPYLAAFAGLSYGVGLVLQSYGLLESLGVHRYLAPVIFLAWYAVSAWAYYRLEEIELRQ